jgi:hypothetical protein
MFTIERYVELLSAFLALGYRACDFLEARPERRDLVLRHDIDVWPQYALPIAEAEASLGLAASYFILVTSPLYNPASAESRVALRRLADLGHRVELHFDPVAAAGDDPDADVERECMWLAEITGRPVRIVSFHRPGPELLNNPAPVAGRPHTYQPRFFSEIGYCSDSRGEWKGGAPLDHPSVAAGKALQLLTHPIWWRGHETPTEALDAFMEDRVAALEADLAANVTVYLPRHRRPV